MQENSTSRRVIRFLLTYASGPLLGLLAFVYVNRGLEIREDSIAPLVWALIAYAVAQHVISALDAEIGGGSMRQQLSGIRQEIFDTAERFRIDLQGRSRVSRVLPDEFDNRLTYSLRRALHVKNTYIGLSDTNGVSSQKHDQICEYYNIILSKLDSTWEDLVGVGDFFDGRFEQLNSECELPFIGKHHIHIINTDTPVLNFLLIGGGGEGFSEVYFGWLPTSTNDAPMFYCNDPNIVSMFESYFNSLKQGRDAIPLAVVSYDLAPDKRFSKSYIYRLRGRWLSLSGAVSQIPAQGSGLRGDAGKHELKSYAIISIIYNKEWKIRGRVYRATDGRFLYSFNSVACLLIGNSLYYRYHNYGEFDHLEAQGIGIYSLGVTEDVLHGYYVKETPHLLGGARGDGSGKAAPLRAVKIAEVENLGHSDFLDIIAREILGIERTSVAVFSEASPTDGLTGGP